MIVPSGKYKGKSHKVLIADVSYCQWILNNLMSNQPLHKFLKLCLNIPISDDNACWICLTTQAKDRKNTHEKMIHYEHPTCKKEFSKRQIKIHRELKLPYAMEYVFSDDDE